MIDRMRCIAPWLCLFAAYVVLAWLGTIQGEGAYRWAMIEGSNLLGIDDAYRYFLSKYAFVSSQIYTWDYVLPVSTLFFGLITLTAMDDVFVARALVAFFAVLGTYVLHAGLMRAGASRRAANMSVLVYALMPVVAVMNVSFYGEMLLLALYSACVYTFIRGQYRLLAVVASLLPLVRPEGIFLLAPVSIFLLIRKHYVEFLISGSAGFAFLVFLLVSFSGDLSYLYEWRLEIRRVWRLFLMPNTYAFPVFGTFNPLWVIPGVIGLFLPAYRHLWPVWSGAFVWLMFYATLVGTGMSSYESRYLIACFPALVLGYMASTDWLLGYRAAGLRRMLPYALCAFVVGEHLLQIDPIKHIAGGQRLPFNSVQVFHPEFESLDTDDIDDIADTAAKVSSLIARHPQLDTILVFDPDIFYFLPDYLTETDIRIFLAPIPQQISVIVTGGSYFTYSQFGKKFAYFDLFAPQGVMDGAALYVGHLDVPKEIPRYSFGDRKIFVVGYRESEEPADLLDKPIRFYK